jgi:hypothetical protein
VWCQRDAAIVGAVLPGKLGFHDGKIAIERPADACSRPAVPIIAVKPGGGAGRQLALALGDEPDAPCGPISFSTTRSTG